MSFGVRSIRRVIFTTYSHIYDGAQMHWIHTQQVGIGIESASYNLF